MGKIGAYLFDIFIAILIMFAAVAIYFGLRTETVVKTFAVNTTENFMEEVKKNGSFIMDDYEKLIEKLSLTDSLYDISFEHKYSIEEPEYRMKTLEEIKEEQKKAYTGTNQYTYLEVATEKPIVNDPVNTGSLNTETNESVLAKATNSPASADHVHTDACFTGHRHITSCEKIVSGDKSKASVLSYSNYQFGFAGYESTDTIGIDIRCANCRKLLYRVEYMKCENDQGWYNSENSHNGYNDINKNYGWVSSGGTNYIDIYSGEGTSRKLLKSISRYISTFSFSTESPSGYWYVGYNSNMFQYEHRAFNPAWNDALAVFDTLSSYVRAPLGLSAAFITNYYTGALSTTVSHFEGVLPLIPYDGCYTCGNEIAYICGQTQDKTPDCNQIVTNVAATNSTQTVAVGDTLITTVRATYLDGSQKTVIATTNFSTNSIGQYQQATLTYEYTLSGVKYSKQCTITVTVIPRTKTCSNGHIYNLNVNGSDPGCPYCKAWVKNISFINPSSTNITITIGTTLQVNNIRLLITYLDNHREEITGGYVDNLDTKYLGTMMVTIGYKGATTLLRVTNVCAKIKCDICGNTYELYPDGTNPGCPYCLTKIPVFTGNVLTFDEVKYTEEILESLYKNGTYKLNQNDTFIIKMNSKSTNMARNIISKIIPSISDQWLTLRISEKISTD